MALKIKVTHVDTCSFIRSEMTNLNTQIEKAKLKLGPNEASILFSMMGNQVILIKRPEIIQMGTRPRRMYIHLNQGAPRRRHVVSEPQGAIHSPSRNSDWTLQECERRYSSTLRRSASTPRVGSRRLGRMSDTILFGPQVGTGFVIKELWAVVVVHDDGDESVPAVMAPNGAFVPLIAADLTRLEWLKETAKSLANTTTKKLTLVRFDTRTDVGTFGGSR